MNERTNGAGSVSIVGLNVRCPFHLTHQGRDVIEERLLHATLPPHQSSHIEMVACESVQLRSFGPPPGRDTRTEDDLPMTDGSSVLIGGWGGGEEKLLPVWVGTVQSFGIAPVSSSTAFMPFVIRTFRTDIYLFSPFRAFLSSSLSPSAPRSPRPRVRGSRLIRYRTDPSSYSPPGAARRISPTHPPARGTQDGYPCKLSHKLLPIPFAHFRLLKLFSFLSLSLSLPPSFDTIIFLSYSRGMVLHFIQCLTILIR